MMTKKAIPRRLCFADAALKKQIKEMDNYNFLSTVSVGFGLDRTAKQLDSVTVASVID